MSRVDRVIHFVEGRVKNIFKSYKKLSDVEREQVLFIPFDNFLTNTYNYIGKIEKLIGRKSTLLTKKALKREHCPTVINEDIRKEKKRKIMEIASDEGIEIMESLIKEHQEFTFGL